jgi:hypothetical protein
VQRVAAAVQRANEASTHARIVLHDTAVGGRGVSVASGRRVVRTSGTCRLATCNPVSGHPQQHLVLLQHHLKELNDARVHLAIVEYRARSRRDVQQQLQTRLR